MPFYTYTARDAKGASVSGKVEAANETAAVGILQGRGLLVTGLLGAAMEGVPASTGPRRVRKHKRVKPDDLIFFISQAAALLDAGIPLLRAMEVISEQTLSLHLANVLNEIKANIKAGSTFKDALARHPKVFPPFWSFLIEAGETSGNLPFILNQLAKNLEASHNLKKKVVSALIYPMVLVGAAIIAIFVFLIKVIPVFTKLYEDFNAELPAFTAMVVRLSDFVRIYYLFLILGLAAVFVFVKRYLRTPEGRRAVDHLVLRLPIFGPLIVDVIHARLTITLSMMVRSGINLIKSLEITATVTANVVYEKALLNITQEIQQGKALSAALRDNPIFNPMLVQLIMIGEEAGKLPDMVERASKYFESRVDVFVARLGVLIEPVIMVIVGVLIGALVIAMFLPILTLSSVVR